MKRVAIVGLGSIGNHLAVKLTQEEIDVCFVHSSTMTRVPFETLFDEESPDAVFLAISTKDTGEAARDYILTCVKMGIPVITCEKGALAYHAHVLQPYMHLIGHNATVGGGTQMLKYMQGRHLDTCGPVLIQAVVNGTLNFIFDEISRGRSLDEACREACKLGYAEPGAKGPLSLINGELRDVVLKTCVILNVGIGVECMVTPDFFPFRSLTEAHLEILEAEGANLRFQVSFSNTKDVSEGYAITVFTARYGNWSVAGGFKMITPAQNWLPGGVGNALHLTEGKLGAGGKYTLSGPGAGLEPTTSAMLADFKEFCK